MIINSGSAEHKRGHWLTNKECVHILHLWLLVLHLIIKQYSVDIFQLKKKKKKLNKVLAKTLLISHSFFSGTFLSPKTSNQKVGYSRSALKYSTAVCQTFLLISWVWALNLVIYQTAITHIYSLTSKGITFTWNWNILHSSQRWNFALFLFVQAL